MTTQLLLLTFLLLGGGAYQQPGEQQTSAPPVWEARGTLLEACTCAVPCTCNFGEGPSPHHYCHAVYAYRLEKATWNGINLSGLIVAGADGPKGRVGFLDNRATAEQKPALENIARQLFAQGGPSPGARKFLVAPITQSTDEKSLRLNIAGYGGFTAQVLKGRDGTRPIVVENNTIWPIFRAIKGKTGTFTFKESTTGEIETHDTNANYGEFSLPPKPR